VHNHVPLFGFTLLRLTDRAESAAIEGAVRARGAPLRIAPLQGDTTRGACERDLVLACPDLQWSGAATNRQMIPTAWSPAPQDLARAFDIGVRHER
jgi:hypothetical protein